MKTRFELRVNDSALQIGIGRLKKIIERLENICQS